MDTTCRLRVRIAERASLGTAPNGLAINAALHKSQIANRNHQFYIAVQHGGSFPVFGRFLPKLGSRNGRHFFASAVGAAREIGFAGE